jgi:hypothetical protein
MRSVSQRMERVPLVGLTVGRVGLDVSKMIINLVTQNSVTQELSCIRGRFISLCHGIFPTKYCGAFNHLLGDC